MKIDKNTFKKGDIVRNRLSRGLYKVIKYWERTQEYPWGDETELYLYVESVDGTSSPHSDYAHNFYPATMEQQEKIKELKSDSLRRLIIEQVKGSLDDYVNATNDKIINVNVNFENNEVTVITKDLGKVYI